MFSGSVGVPKMQGNLKVHSLPPSAAEAAKSLQSCPTLYDPIDGSPPGSPVHGIFQARVLEWGAIAFSKAWKWKVKSLSRVRLCATPWTAAHQAPPSMGFSRQEYWSGCHRLLCCLLLVMLKEGVEVDKRKDGRGRGDAGNWGREGRRGKCRECEVKAQVGCLSIA